MNYLGFERLTEAGNLPIFRRLLDPQDTDSPALYYAPGYVVRASGDARREIDQTIAQVDRGPMLSALGVLLVEHARETLARWEDLLTAPFQPLCLTVYPTSNCNLRCTYCYAATAAPATAAPATAAPVPSETLPGAAQPALLLEAVREAARIVAVNCRAQGRPFTLVVHGGGEPTADPKMLEAVVQAAEETAALFRLAMFKYIATNGVMAQSRARWLARNFDLVGISCDGPEDIQSVQRPLLNGKSSLPFVEQTAEILRTARRPFNVRVTVTPETVERQEEIVRYICARLRPSEIHIEAVYQGGRASAGLGSVDSVEARRFAGRFVEHFQRAQTFATEADTRLLYTGTRPFEIHGPYCNILRGVLNLVPSGGTAAGEITTGGGAATACFKLSDAAQVQRLNTAVGGIGEEGFEIDHPHIMAMRKTVAATPPRCQDCFNQYHCARGCPDACPLEGSAINDFRCAVQMRLAAEEIELAAMTAGFGQGSAAGARLSRGSI